MSDQMAKDLRDYAYTLFADEVYKDARDQVEVWEQQINRIIGYAKVAQRQQQAAVKEIQDQMKANAELALMTLSLLGGPALSLFTGTLQYKVFAKFFGKPKQTAAHISIPRPTPAPPPPTPPPIVPPGGIPRTYHKPKVPPGPTRTPMQRFNDRKLENRNAKGYKEQQDALKKQQDAIKRQQEAERIASQVPKDDKYHVIDPEAHSRVGAKVLGDTAGQLLAMKVNLALRPKHPIEKYNSLVNAQSAVDASTSLEMFEANLRNSVLAAKAYVGSVIQSYARTIDEDLDFGKRWLAMLKNDYGHRMPNQGSDRAMLEFGRKTLRLAMENQRSIWASDKTWFYYGHNPANIVEPYGINAFESQLWALWIQSEEFKLETTTLYYGDGTGVERVGTRGRSGISLDKIVPRLVQIGVIKSDNEVQRRIIAKSNPSIGLLPMEIDDVDVWINTPEELNSIHKWTQQERKPLTSIRSGATPRPMSPLIER